MGQQQLLLLVLGIVIVGLAVVVGIQAFGENQAKANADALVNDGVRIASDAQAWALKPQAFGGGANNADNGLALFENLTLAQLGYDDPYSNLNGVWDVSGTPGATFVVVGCSEDNENEVTVTVSGTAQSRRSRVTVSGLRGSR